MGMVNRKRIAGNTLMMYLRMGLIMLVSLYASRIVLAALGETDFGLYDAIGGIVVAFAFLNGVMNSSCNRFYSVELGRQNYEALHRVFSVNLIIFLVLAAGILVLAETAGLWLLERKMNIPADRMTAARWVYQLSIFSFLAGVLSIPYKAIITAKEKLKVYAYCSIVEALLKLGAVFLLAKAPFDRLIFYSVLMLIVSVGTNGFYAVYCRHFYDECKGRIRWDRELGREIIGFNGWGVIGSLATIGKNQGLKILLNMFYGPVVNAAKAVANQVYFTTFEFVRNYVLAFNPQIVKSYAAGEKDDMMKLVFQSSKITYFLLFVIVMPLMLEMSQVLDLWLVDVPERAVKFTMIMLLASLIDANHDPLFYAVQATGKIKWYNILVGSSQLLIVILSYIVLKTCTVEPEFVLWILVVFTVIGQIIRIILTKHYVGMRIRDYLRKVLSPIALVTILSPVIPYYLTTRLPATLWRLALTVVVSIVIVVILVYLIGLDREERATLKQFLRRDG